MCSPNDPPTPHERMFQFHFVLNTTPCSYVTELTEHIKVKSGQTEDDDAEYMQFFPSFVWTVRDFTLELKLEGQAITADQYLENALKLKPGERNFIYLSCPPKTKPGFI